MDNLEKAKQELLTINDAINRDNLELEKRAQNLKSINLEIENSKKILNDLEGQKNIKNGEVERIKSNHSIVLSACNKEICDANSKLSGIKYDYAGVRLNKETDEKNYSLWKEEKARDKESILKEISAHQTNKGTIELGNQELLNKNKKISGENSVLEENKKQLAISICSLEEKEIKLINNISNLEAQISSYQRELSVFGDEIKNSKALLEEIKNDIVIKNREVDEVKGKIVSAGEELSSTLRKTANINVKKDYLTRKEAYIADQYKNIGVEYASFK